MLDRAAALRTVDQAIADRLAHMVGILADSYTGSANAKAAAREHFQNGLTLLTEAHKFAEASVTVAFAPAAGDPLTARAPRD